MKLLALDTSSEACSVALQHGDDVIERHEEKPREHTRILMPMIRSVLDEAGVAVSGLDAIVLGNGPGSFIGMRIAASVAQGLAFAAGLEIVPVSSLAAVAAQVMEEQDADNVVVTQDAHMNEVYLGLYGADSDATLREVAVERLHGMHVIPELASGSWVAAGFGWKRYPELLSANADHLESVSEILYPRATCLVALGSKGLRDGLALSPQDIEPAYLRHKVARKPAPAT